MFSYNNYPISKSIQSAVIFDPATVTEDAAKLAQTLHRAGIYTLNHVGLAYFSERGREALENMLEPSYFLDVERFARTRFLQRGLPITVVWKDADDEDSEAAWPCTVLNVLPTPGDYEVRCHADNTVWAVSTFNDELLINPSLKGIPRSFLVSKIKDTTGATYEGHFTEDGLLHDDNVVFTSPGGITSRVCAYRNGVFVNMSQ